MHTDYLKYVQRCRKKIQSGVAILQIKVMAISILHIMTYQHWQLTIIKAEGTAQHSLQASIVAMSVHVNDDPYLIFHSKSGEAQVAPAAVVPTPLSMSTVLLQKVWRMAYIWDFDSALSSSSSITIVPQAPSPHYYA